MKPVYRPKFHIDKSDYSNGPAGSYDTVVSQMGEVLLQVSFGDYQGDTFVLLRGWTGYSTRIGFLSYGWGSCSGCDAWEACDTVQEGIELADALYDSIQWFDDEATALKWFKSHDWRGDWSWRDPDARKFVLAARALLGDTFDEA